MSEFIWVIAGGAMQIPLIDECHKRGYKVFCTDGDEDCVGATSADQFVPIDTYDVYSHIDLASSMTEKPVAVLTVGADIGPTVSAVADELDLLAVDYEVAKIARNKAKMHDALAMSHPVYKVVSYRREDQTRILWERHCKMNDIDPYPCVLKPLERAGSRGVSLVSSPFEFSRAQRSAEVADGGMNNHFIIEEYLSGEHVATDSFVVDGKAKVANAVYRVFSDKHFGVEVYHINPFEPPKKVRDIIAHVAKRLGVDWGALKVDFIHTPHYGWVVTDCATRLSGGWDSMYAAPLATGKNIMGYMLDMALGNKPNHKDLWNTKKQFACTYAVHIEPGVIDTVTLPLHDVNGLKFSMLTHQTVEPLTDCSKRPYFIITVGDTAYQAYRRALLVERGLQVTYKETL